MKIYDKFKILFLFSIVQICTMSLVYAQKSASPSQLKNGSATFSYAVEKLQNLKFEHQQLKEKYDMLVKEPSTDNAVVRELQQKIEILEIKIAERTAKQNSFLEEEKRFIERETGYVYQDHKTISDEVAAFEKGNVSKELNQLKYDMLVLQADVEKNFRSLSEEDKAQKKIAIMNLRKQINKLEEKIQNSNQH